MLSSHHEAIIPITALQDMLHPTLLLSDKLLPFLRSIFHLAPFPIPRETNTLILYLLYSQFFGKVLHR